MGELEEGEYYALCSKNNHENVDYFIKVNEFEINNNNIFYKANHKTIRNDYGIWSVRRCTSREIEWVELCIKNNKFMPKPEFKEIFYTIY